VVGRQTIVSAPGFIKIYELGFDLGVKLAVYYFD
jgi:hypothetical protein